MGIDSAMTVDDLAPHNVVSGILDKDLARVGMRHAQISDAPRVLKGLAVDPGTAVRNQYPRFAAFGVLATR